MDIPVIHKGVMVSAPRNRWSKLRTRLMLGVLVIGAAIAAMLIATPNAHADGVLSAYEKSYGDATYPVVCSDFDTTDNFRDEMIVTALAIQQITGLSVDNVGDIIKYQIAEYCPRHSQSLYELQLESVARQGGYKI